VKDKVLDVLKEQKKAINLMEINDLLSLKSSDEFKELSETINELIKDGLVHETKKHCFILVDYCSSLKSGKIAINKSGNGFLIVPGEEDIYIDRTNINDAINNDRVLVDIFSYHGKQEGKVIKILDRNLDNIVGQITFQNNHLVFVPDDDKLDIEISLAKESTTQCVDGHKVYVEITKKINNNHYLGRVVKIIGHKDDPGIDILSIAYRHGIKPEFSDEVSQELEDMPTAVRNYDCAGRKDLTKDIIFTIDGDDTKDIDDAISLTMKGDNYVLGVHIADVSNYVKINSAIYDEAFKRGTSSYLADTVIPMLPHQLSNGICSLNPNEKRLTISCVMEINPAGKVVDYDIFPSFIESKMRMTYKKVNKILMENEVPEGYEPFSDILIKMNELAHILRKEKTERGYIDFDLDEPKIVQDEKGVAIDIRKRERHDGEKLIEDFMIAANETVAQHIDNMDLPFIYRVHDVPNQEKIDDFLNFIKILGYTINTKVTNLTPITMQKILAELKDKKEIKILSDVLLRSMKKAIYSTNNIGHFGIGSKSYTHFTSPIRRFPDLTVHRLLRLYLFESKLDNETLDFQSNYLITVAEQSSEREQEAIEAEREVNDMKMAEYMENHLNEEYRGIIDSVTKFGLFVELDNLIEGLVHISTLNGFYEYVPEMLSLVSQDKKKSYRLGDEVTVKVVGANKQNGQIDFELVEGDGSNGSKK
jgi:ribonuclease R